MQAATSRLTKQSLQESIFSPTQEKLKNKKFPSLQQNKTSTPHKPLQTDTNFNGNHHTTQHLRSFQGDTGDKRNKHMAVTIKL